MPEEEATTVVPDAPLTLDQLTQQRASARADADQRRNAERVKTRVGRFKERFVQAFGKENESLMDSWTIQADGTESPSVAWAEISFQGRTHRAEFLRDEKGIGFYVNENRIFGLTGKDYLYNLDRLLEALQRTPEDAA